MRDDARAESFARRKIGHAQRPGDHPAGRLPRQQDRGDIPTRRRQWAGERVWDAACDSLAITRVSPLQGITSRRALRDNRASGPARRHVGFLRLRDRRTGRSKPKRRPDDPIGRGWSCRSRRTRWATLPAQRMAHLRRDLKQRSDAITTRRDACAGQREEKSHAGDQGGW